LTGPVEVLLLPELEPPQAARGAMITSARLTVASQTRKPRVRRKEKRYCIVRALLWTCNATD
jgi:hypothetical protein